MRGRIVYGDLRLYEPKKSGFFKKTENDVVRM